MDVYRKLVYEDKTSLDAFDINEEGSLNNLIYDDWLLTRKELRGDDSRILKVLNDAYYLCTMAFVSLYTKFNISYAKEMVEAPSVVIPLIKFYLSKIGNLPTGTRRFWKSINSVMEEKWTENYNELEKVMKDFNFTISTNLFIKRALTPDLLVSIPEIDWRTITKEYKKDSIQHIASILAKNREEWCMLIKSIKSAAQKYDYDYGFEDIEEECFDEDGPYTRIISVPINPYDNEGNEILEPLKRAGVYQFCDELMEKYDELVEIKKKSTPQITKKDESAKITHKNNEEKTSIFSENLNSDVIATTLKDLKMNYIQSLGERKFYKIAYDVLIQLRWLYNTKKTCFVKWAQEKRIMEATSKDLKGLSKYTNEDLHDTILNKFSEKQKNGKYKDRDDFYLLTPQGDIKRKINKG